MPRQTRIDVPGALHYVIISGIERKADLLNPAKGRMLLEAASCQPYGSSTVFEAPTDLSISFKARSRLRCASA
jgi:hypothetical protein